ncbi:hypothetical protein ACFYTS_10885 [Nocardia sp. NPDC004151]|uniref:hypothetical protein n=1 Tax=Nocardia sp. NPDC004151 TaxID=3364304 RepID=UPI00367E80E9
MSEHGEFLKAKRAAVSPDQVGLPAVGDVELDWHVLQVLTAKDQALVTYTAPEGRTAMRSCGFWGRGMPRVRCRGR